MLQYYIFVGPLPFEHIAKVQFFFKTRKISLKKVISQSTLFFSLALGVFELGTRNFQLTIFLAYHYQKHNEFDG